MRIFNIFYLDDLTKVLVKVVNGEKIIEYVKDDFLPYYYDVIVPDSKDVVSYERINGYYKIYAKHPKIIPLLRSSESREADIPYTVRWYLDKKIDLGNERLKVCYIDVEVETSGKRFPTFDDKILSIAAVSDEIRKVFYLYDYASEAEMLKDFFVNIKEYPILAGWNVSFDRNFIVERCKRNNLRIEPRYFVWIDLLDLYKRFVTAYSKTTITTSYSLDSVAQVELGESKLDKGVLFEKNGEKIKEYNLRDAELCMKIDKKLRLIELIDNISITTNLLIEDCLHFSSVVEKMVLRELNGKVLLRNRSRDEEEQTYEGAFVSDAPVGFFRNVYVIDFSSMYPNIIRTFNISIETLVEDCKENEDVIRTPAGVCFKREDGVYKKIISRLMELRKYYKEKYKQTGDETFNTLQVGVKFLLASFYGVLGFSGSRLFNKKIAETITKTGRWLCLELKKYVESVGCTYLYSDTDSSFVTNVENIENVVNGFNSYIAEKVKEFGCSENYLKVELDKKFDVVYFYGKKKRYVGLVEGKLVARGLEIRRTDWCKLAVEYETELVNKLLNEGLNSAINYHTNFIKNIRKQPLEKFVIYKSITKPVEEYKVLPPHVRVADSVNYIGEKIGYVVTSFRNGKIVGVEKYEKAKNVCYDYYIQRQILPIYERLLKPLLQNSNLRRWLNAS